MSPVAFRWFAGGLVPVPVVSSRRVPYRVQVPVKIQRPRGVKPLPAVPTPIFDLLAWELGHPLVGPRPSAEHALAGVVVAAGAR